MEFDLQKYRGKNILILGGGTSTLDVKWENLDYDYVWTCNQFFLEPRVLSQNIELYLLSPTVDVTDTILQNKLKGSSTYVFIEGPHYRGLEHLLPFKEFAHNIGIPVHSWILPTVEKSKNSAGFSGAVFRLILAALQSNANQIFFSGFDGFDRQFSNIHAFTKHPGLKPTDTRRTFEGTRESYTTVFTDAYRWLAMQPGHDRLQNLGEGFDYNIGTPLSKKYFPLKKEVYDKIR